MFLLRYFIKFTSIIPALIWLLPHRYYISEKFSTAAFRGPLIIAQNHRGFMDYPVMLLMFFFRRVHVIVSEMMYDYSKGLTFLLKVFGVIKADRFTGSPEFISKSVAILKKGGIVLIYPEGKIETADEIYEFKKSVALLSLQSGAPVLPIFHDGRVGLFKRDSCLLGGLMYPGDYISEEDSLAVQAGKFTDDIRDNIVEYKRIYDRSIKKKIKTKWRPHPVYNFLKYTAAPLLWFFLRPDVRFENDRARAMLHHKNSMLIISNHTWWLDPPMLYYVFRRRMVRCIAAKEVAEEKFIIRTMETAMGCLFLDRSGFDWNCMRSCISLLRQGGALIVFPEGRLNMDGDIAEFKTGPATMGFVTDTPVVPVYIDGCYKTFKKVHLLVGEPMYLEECVPGTGLDGRRIDEATRMMRKKVQYLRESLESTMSSGEKRDTAEARAENRAKV